MYRFRDEYENIWNAFRTFTGLPGRIDFPLTPSQRAWPRVDLFLGGDHALVRAAVPGLAPEDVSVEVEGDLVTLTCARPAEGEREERLRGTRKLRLPFRADADRAKATLRRGVFELRLEQLQSDKPAQITVKAD